MMMNTVAVHLMTHGSSVVHVGSSWIVHHVIVIYVADCSVGAVFALESSAVLHMVEVVHAAVDEAILAEAELVTRVQLSLADLALEAAQVEY